MSNKKIYDKQFEAYWKANGQSLIEAAPPVLSDERKNNGKMNTAGDWLLFIIPLVAGIGFMNAKLIESEMVNLIVGLAIVVVCFGIAMMIRPYVTGKRSIADIDADIKDYFYAIYKDKGTAGLDSQKTK